MQWGHIWKANYLCLFQLIVVSKVCAPTSVCMTSCAHVELESELPRSRARLCKVILEFKGTHDNLKNSYCLYIMHAGASAPGVRGLKCYNSYSMILQSFRPSMLYTQRCQTDLTCRSCTEKITPNASTGRIWTAFWIPTPILIPRITRIGVSEPLQICVWLGRCQKRINATAAGVA